MVSPSLAMNASNLTVPPSGEFDLVSAHLAQPAHSGSSVLLLSRFFNLWMTDPGIPQGGGGDGSDQASQKHFAAHETCAVSSLPPSEPSSFIPAFSVCAILCDLHTLFCLWESVPRGYD